MSNNNKTPAIRFKGFTDTWEQRELRTAATFSKGSGYSKNDLKENGTPIILYGRLYTKYETVISEVDTFVDVQPNSVYSTGHEVIVPASGETAEDISRASFVAKSGILLGGDLNIIVPDDYINPVFLALTISNGNQQKELSKRAQGKSVVHIHNSDLENVVLLYPKYEEQEKIGEYFSKLDTLITLHQRKCDKLIQFKAAMLKKMFPQNGADKPELRFKGFTDAWEQREFGDENDLITGYPFESDCFSETGINLIRGMNVKRGYIDLSNDICVKWTSSKGLESYLLKENDIIIQMDGALIGKSYGIIKKKHLPALLVQRVTRARINNEIADSDFMYQTIQRDFLTYISMNKTETAVPHLSLNDIKNFGIMVPTLLEQKMIGSFFANLDRLITLHQRKCDKYKSIKAGLIRKFFP